MRYLFIVFLLLISSPVKAEAYVDDYVPATFENISNLMWRLNVHDLDNADAIKEYFQATNCDLYSAYYRDDFVWKNITEAFIRDKRYFSDQIPNKFYIQASIPIDRYDFNQSAFIIDKKYAFDNAGSIAIPFEINSFPRCGKISFNRNYFPYDVKFIANEKFELSQIPVKRDDANAMLERIKKYKYENINSNRVVTIRFLITINDVDSYIVPKVSYIQSQITFTGTLDEIAFFEDPEMTKEIWKKHFKVFEE